MADLAILNQWYRVCLSTCSCVYSVYPVCTRMRSALVCVWGEKLLIHCNLIIQHKKEVIFFDPIFFFLLYLLPKNIQYFFLIPLCCWVSSACTESKSNREKKLYVALKTHFLCTVTIFLCLSPLLWALGWKKSTSRVPELVQSWYHFWYKLHLFYMHQSEYPKWKENEKRRGVLRGTEQLQ